VSTWVALLRGVNVGGGNKVRMAELRATFEELGHTDVATYVNSGNVVFSAAAADVTESSLVESITAAIVDRHGLDVPVVVRAADDLARIAEGHPDDGGPIEPKYLHVVFLDAAPSTDRTLDAEPYEPDRFVVDGREIYSTYPDGSGRSKLTVEVFERAFGVTATARNLNTVRKLAALTDR
jgi:uncharacterized protein (DUF1697 family)